MSLLQKMSKYKDPSTYIGDIWETLTRYKEGSQDKKWDFIMTKDMRDEKSIYSYIVSLTTK